LLNLTVVLIEKEITFPRQRSSLLSLKEDLEDGLQKFCVL